MERTCEGTLLVDVHDVPQIPLFEDVFEDVDDEVASSASQA